MRVLQINCVYKRGSTGKIVYDLHSCYRSRGMESYVCYGRGTPVSEDGVYKTASELLSKGNNLASRFTGIPYGGAFIGTRKLIAKIKEIAPDVVHLHCINGYFVNIYTLLNYLKKKNIPTVLTLHAEFMHTGSCAYALDCEKWKTSRGCERCFQLREATGSYLFDRTHAAWKRMYAAFYGFDNLRVVSVSPWLQQRAKESYILKDKTNLCVLNGIDTTVFSYAEDALKLRERLGLTDKKVVLYVTAAFSAFKGADYVMNLAQQMPEVTFVVVGNHEPIPDCPNNLLAVGRTENQNELACYYSMADVTVLVSKKETFSMVCAESLCCGTPVVGFMAGGPESISVPEYSMFSPYGDVRQLKTNLQKMLRSVPVAAKQEISAISKSVYTKETMCNQYLGIYEEILND